MAVEREDLRDWHRLFGLLLTDFFTSSLFRVDVQRRNELGHLADTSSHAGVVKLLLTMGYVEPGVRYVRPSFARRRRRPAIRPWWHRPGFRRRGPHCRAR